MIYLEEADTNRAFGFLENLATSTSTTLPSTVPTLVSTPTISTAYFNVDYNGQNIVYAFTNKLKKEDRFTGRIEEDFNEYIANYIDTCDDINVENGFRLKYLLNILYGEAERMYQYSIQSIAKTCSEACDSLRNEYIYTAHLIRLGQYLQSPCFTNVVNGEKYL